MSTDPLDDLRKLMARYRFFLVAPRTSTVCWWRCRLSRLRGDPFFRTQSSNPISGRTGIAEAIFMIPRSLLVFDHRLRTLKIVINAFLEDGPPEKIYAQAVESIDGIVRKLGQSADLPLLPTANSKPQRVDSNFNPEQFENARWNK